MAVWPCGRDPMMLIEALGSALLGLVLAGGAVHRLSHRLPTRSLVLATGTAGALFGAFVTHTALDPGNILLILLGAAVVWWRRCPCSCGRPADCADQRRRRGTARPATTNSPPSCRA